MNRRPLYPNPLLTVLTLLLLALTLTSTMAGCSSDDIEMAGGGTEVGNPKTLVAFAGDSAMEGYLKTAYAENLLPENAFDTVGAPTGEEAAPPVVTPDGASDYYPQPGLSAEDAVAPPVVLADDSRLFVATEGAVTIVRAVPPEALAVTGVLTVPGRLQALYQHDDTLAAVYTPTGGEGTIREEAQETGNARLGTPYWIPAGVRTGVLLADISNPVAPRRVRRVEFDGLLTASRRYGDRLVLATQFLPDLPDLAYRYPEEGPVPADAVEDNRQVLADLPIDDLLPLYQAWDGAGAPLASGRLVGPRTLYRPTEKGGGSIVSLLTFRLEPAGTSFDRVGLAADIHGIHMADDALYLAGVRWRHQSGPGASTYSTDIFRMAVTPAGIAPDAAGTVEGRLLDPLSMGTGAGTLRIATALAETGEGGASAVGVFLLTADETHLSPLPSFTHASPETAVDAARFDGPLGYLFTADRAVMLLDLSTPSAPRSIGALPLDGRAASIRRIGGDHLLTLTREAGGEAPLLALWEIVGPDGPVRLHEEPVTVREMETALGAIPGAYDPAEGLLAIPVSLSTPDDPTNAPVSRGVGIFRFDITTGFEDLGFVESPVDATNAGAAIGGRPLFTGETLYIVTTDGVRAVNATGALSVLGTIWFNTI